MTLQQLFQGLTEQTVSSIPVTGIACHSKQVRAGEVFVAIRGPHHDGHAFLKEAIQRGACAVVVEHPPTGPCACPVIVVEETKQILRTVASRWYGEPARRLRFIGVTGTNGKTTTTYLIKTILDAAGHRVGLLGTVVYEIGGRQLPSINTTPGVLELQRLFAEMVEQGLSWCAMEVSSHALDQGRIDGVQFEAAVFTNLGSDHLDYHRTLERYAAAKRRLFGYLRPEGRAVINVDDRYGQTLVDALTGQSVLTYGVEPGCRLSDEKDSTLGTHPSQVSVRALTCSWEGMTLVLDSPWGTLPLHTPLVGRHNVLNLAAAGATGLALGVNPSVIQRALGGFPQVPGRMERVPNDAGIIAVIDYAHTTDALRLVLLSLRELVRGRLIVVFGCGGDRDRTKRPAMGRIASLLADEVVLTSDNPRSEDPLEIIHQIKAGFEPGFRDYQAVIDREQAIMTALSMARSDDAVLIAGKGHEAYQIFDHITVPFSDRAVVERYCSTRQSVALA
ncbi:MAG: UDP-N-acetylmuramoyl-L-alanyl-D-glutamate--2,6-diaminopimelate ligase [Candidatus Omnitrophica bacterium]|nr:UDP-N-acetylmuramoyl-L-alanyl-D-glutamate--2,6-diaminopimelate ligase [Candidatus Omnitrophota bacterium]